MDKTRRQKEGGAPVVDGKLANGTSDVVVVVVVAVAVAVAVAGAGGGGGGFGGCFYCFYCCNKHDEVVLCWSVVQACEK